MRCHVFWSTYIDIFKPMAALFFWGTEFTDLCVLISICFRLIFVNKLTRWTIFFSYMFVSILYMFRAAICPSSGELIVSMRHLVYVTLCRWQSSVQFDLAYQTVMYTEWHIPGDALIRLILLMMGTWLPETFRE